MPITITPTSPGGLFGPGLQAILTSDFIGPLAPPAYFQLTAYDSSNEVILFSSQNNNPYLPGTSIIPFTKFAHETDTAYFKGQADGSTIHLQATLTDTPSGIPITEDTGTATATLSNTAGLAAVIQANAGAGGLTDSEAAQLNEVQTNTEDLLTQIATTITTPLTAIATPLGQWFSQKTLDQLTLDEYSPGDCTGDPVTHDISNQWVWGIIVRLCTIPLRAQPITPDDDYYLETLAVLTIFRGTDKLQRIPIHQSSIMHAPLPGYNWGLITEATLATVPPWTTIEVDWAVGVTGRVFGMKFP